MIGRTLSHFEIIDRLGAGGMGEVYLARDTRLERKVALKVLPEALADDPERLARLVREAKALAALDHPHIVTVFSVDEADGVHFVTMAYVEGQTLDQLIPEEGLPVDRLLDCAVPLADALRAAHERGIIHRDLKPANVMVDAEGRLRVLDFGLAKRDVDPTAGLIPGEMSHVTTQGLTAQMTREGTILGSYPYMSPEQAEGRPVDARSDLFSLGTLLYEMSCGDRPFQGGTGIALITAILRDAPAPLAERRPDLPGRLVEIIERCLEKDPEERYAVAADLRRDLERVREEVAAGTAESVGAIQAAADPDSASDEVRESHKAAPPEGRLGFNRLLLIAIIVVLAVLGSTWIWRAMQSAKARPTGTEAAAAAAPDISSIAVLPLANLTGDPEQEYLVDGMTEALITDLSKIGALKVISRSSVMRFKGTEESVAEIAAQLGVEAVVQGSVIREGDRVAVTTQLIEATSGAALWAERYERDMTSILTLQSEVARAIAKKIQVTLTPAEQERLAAVRNVDPAAHEAYLKGKFHQQRFTPEDFQLALRYFQTAVDIDPEYALAYVGQASAWAYINQFGLIPPREADPKVREPLARALELDDSLAQAHHLQAGWATWFEHDWEAAEVGFKRALELDPNYANAHIFYSHFLSLQGRLDEGTAEARRALELDPVNPFFQGLYGIQIAMTGDLEGAIAQLRRTYEMAPGFNFGRLGLAGLLFQVGREEESLIEIRKFMLETDDQEVLEAIDRGEAESGFQGAVRAAADTLAKRATLPDGPWGKPLQVALFYEFAGDLDRAMEWLEKGYEVRDPGLPYLGARQITPALRAMEGFQDLLTRLGLPDVHGGG